MVTASGAWALLLLLGGSHCSLYKLDTSFTPQWPQGAHMFSGVGVAQLTPDQSRDHALLFVTQRGNSSVPPVLVLNASSGAVVDSWGQDSIALDRITAPSAPTWGSHGIAVELCEHVCVPETSCRHPRADSVRVWIDDFTNHTVTAFDACGQRLLQLGTPGTAGNGTNPLQFGSVADSAVVSGQPTLVYSSDGDGGTANRVVAVAVTEQLETSVQWATDSIFDNPHSIALHSSGMIIIANRDANETRLLDAVDGKDLGVWDCGLRLGAAGKPFGVRTLEIADRNLVFVAIMDNPQDGVNQKVAVLDGSHLQRSEGAGSQCDILQVIQIEQQFSGPHLLGVNPANGDLYAALVSDSPDSTVLRFELV